MPKGKMRSHFKRNKKRYGWGGALAGGAGAAAYGLLSRRGVGAIRKLGSKFMGKSYGAALGKAPRRSAMYSRLGKGLSWLGRTGKTRKALWKRTAGWAGRRAATSTGRVASGLERMQKMGKGKVKGRHVRAQMRRVKRSQRRTALAKMR